MTTKNNSWVTRSKMTKSKKYGIKDKCATTKNLQVNSILEIIIQVIENLVHTFDLQNNYIVEDDPWSGIFAATDVLVQIMHHTKLQATSGHLVFGSDMILNTPFISDSESIRQRNKNKKWKKKNQLEHKNCKPQTYKIQYKILARNKKAKFYEEPYVVPYPITQVWTSKNFMIRQGAVQERINIRWVRPYIG